jgi:hypothetical protein
MDDLLGSIQAKDLFESLPPEELGSPAFPKDAFLALTFGNASAIMSNLSAPGTPLFLVCSEGFVVFMDAPSSACPTETAKAGLANVNGDRRDVRILTLEQAQFLKALLIYMQVGEEVAKQTRSEHLTNNASGDKAAVELFREKLPDLRDLAMALTNFIVSELQGSSGEFFVSFDTSNLKASEQLVGFQDQLEILDALSDSARYFGIPPYQRAAVRAYHHLNSRFYNPITQFYKTGQAHVSTMDMAKALYVLPKVLPYLKEKDSVNQLNALLKVWEDSLRGRKI